MELGNISQYRALDGYKNAKPEQSNAVVAISNNRPEKVNSSFKYSGEYLSHEKMTLNYKNSEGDSFSLNYESVKYQRMSYEGTENPLSVSLNNADKGEIGKEIKELYDLVKENMVKELMKSLGFEIQGTKKGEEVEKTSESKIEGLPEYWNAENTSQRIFEFAVSFHSMSEQDTEGYYKMMREAIISGYDEAIGEIGEVSDEVSSLSQETLRLALEKLDSWAAEQGVNVGSALNGTVSVENGGLDLVA